MKRIVLFFFLLSAIGGAGAQQLPAAPELADRIHAYAEQYRKNLPSFEVDESAVVQRVVDGKLKKEVKLEMTLSEVRDEAKPGEFKDHYTFRLIDGKPPRKHLNLPPFNRPIQLPYFVRGVFSNVIGFGGTRGRSCMEYRVSPGKDSSTVQLEVWNKPGPLPPDCEDMFEDYHKTLLVEPATGKVLHVTRSMSAKAATESHDVSFVDVDFAPQQLGDQTYWLPARFEAHNGTNEGRMTATFSNFHRYTSTVKVIASDPLPEVEP
jgi:hypothetical protein